MRWFDSQAHLDKLTDPVQAMAEARALGISNWLLPGTEPDQWWRVSSRFQDDPGVHLAFGYHPWFIPEQPLDLSALVQQLDSDSQAVAIGEIGLDYFPGKPVRPNREHQEAWFESQLALAVERSLPVIIHSVKAHDRVLYYLKRYPQARGVIHAFSGSYEQAMAYIDKGFRLGCGSLIVRSAKTLDAFCRIPLDRLLLETDAPDMRLPRPNPDNPLLDLIETARYLADARSIPLSDLAEASCNNCRLLFF